MRTVSVDGKEFRDCIIEKFQRTIKYSVPELIILIMNYSLY